MLPQRSLPILLHGRRAPRLLAEIHVLVGRLCGVDKPLHALKLAPRVLVFAVPLELCQDYVEDVVCDGLWVFCAEDFLEEPDGSSV